MSRIGECGVTMALAMLLVCAAGESCAEEASAGERNVSPWIIYKNDETIETLTPVADVLSSVSVCGDAPAEFVGQCQDLGLEVYKLVGGKPGKFDTEDHRKATIEEYIRLCEELGYDGIDLDFESQDAELRPAYTALMRDTAEALRKRGKKLSICVSYLMSTWRTVDETYLSEFYDPEVVGETCDLVRVMCYDMYSLSGKAAGPVSTQPWAKDAMKYWMRYVPRERLVMGLPTYSGDFEMMIGGKETRHYAAPEPIVPEGTKVQRVWLPYEQVNSYLYEGEGGRMHVFYASDATSTRAHVETAKRLGLPCIGFWHFAAVTPEMWDVVRAWHAGNLGEGETGRWLVFP